MEQLFSKLDNGIANLKAAKAKLEIYRQAVLKKAFEGELTKEWRRSLNHDAKDSYDELDLKSSNQANQKNQGSDNGKLPKGWKWVKFEDITKSFDGQRKPLSKAFRENFKGVFPYYGACEIIDYVKEYLFDGTYLLIGEDGANLLSKSKPLAFIATGKFWVNNHAHVVQTNEGIRLKILEYQINSLQLNKYITGTAQQKLTQRNLRRIPILSPFAPSQNKPISSGKSKPAYRFAIR